MMIDYSLYNSGANFEHAHISKQAFPYTHLRLQNILQSEARFVSLCKLGEW